MRRAILLSLVAGVTLALAMLGGDTSGPAQAWTHGDSSSSDLVTPVQPVPPFTPPAPEAPVRAGTPGTDLADVPLQPLVWTESVIPPDDEREYIGAGNNIVAPWRWVAYLVITAQEGYQSQCTGFLIGPRTVITAGHCLYNNGLGPGGDAGWAASVRVVPGKDGAAEPFLAQVETESLWSVDGWIVDGDPEYDYGAIIVDVPFPGLVGSFRYADLAAEGLQPRLSGYPGDHPEEQWWDDDLVTDVAAHIVSYQIDTFGGQSGSPVWYPPASADPEVLAIHTRGEVSSACNEGNCGTRVETTVIANFEYWLALSNPPVGGIAEYPDIDESTLSTAESSSGSLSPPYAALASGLAAALATLTAGVWYARRRSLG